MTIALIMEQFHEIQRIYDNIKRHDIKMDELFVASIIDKFPRTWKDVTSILKYKKEEIDLTQLATHLLIEVGIRKQEKGMDPSSVSTINMVGGNLKTFLKNKKRGFSSFK